MNHNNSQLLPSRVRSNSHSFLKMIKNNNPFQSRALESGIQHLESEILFIYLFILLRLGVTYIKNIEDNYKTRQGHHNSKNQLLWAQIN